MNKFYAGIGSRQTPQEIGELMTLIAELFKKQQYILRSGGADGADTFFEIGATNKEIYLPWKGFNNSSSDLYLGNLGNEKDAEEIVRRIHPAFHKCSRAAKLLHTRNIYQILGQDLKTPVELVICWTKNGESIGGTRTAIELALENNIKVINLFNAYERGIFEELFSIKKENIIDKLNYE